MNEELLKHLSTPGAVAITLIWLHSRVNKLESRLDMIAGHLGAPKPDKKPGVLKTIWPVALAFGLTFLTGCTVMRNKVTTNETDAAGVNVERTTVSTMVSVWDSSQALEKLRVSNGKTHSVGAEGLEQKSGGTNSAAVITAVVGLLNATK